MPLVRPMRADCFTSPFTLRASGSLIRVISARDMHRKEKTHYEQAQTDTTRIRH